jgi:hypothetical protein
MDGREGFHFLKVLIDKLPGDYVPDSAVDVIQEVARRLGVYRCGFSSKGKLSKGANSSAKPTF